MRPRIGSSQVPRWVPVFNQLARPLLAAGVPMGPNGLMTIRGRRSGLPRTTPVTIIESAGRRWVMAPFGDVNWVRNLRAAGAATITVRRRAESVVAIELTHDEAVTFFREILAPLARQYGRLAMWIIRHVDGVDIRSPHEAAQGRPVFELLHQPGAGVPRPPERTRTPS